MIPAGYKEALITYADAKGSAGVQAISDEFDALFALINSSRGKTLTNSSVYAKTFGWKQPITVEEKFAVSLVKGSEGVEA